MKEIIRKMFVEKTKDTKIQLLRYIFVGGISAIINISALYIFKEYLNINYLISNVLGFVFGLTVNYLLSKKLVFAKEKSINKIYEFVIYALIGLTGLVLDTCLLWLFTETIYIYYMVSKIISTFLVFIWNFIARKIMYECINKYKKM